MTVSLAEAGPSVAMILVRRTGILWQEHVSIRRFSKYPRIVERLQAWLDGVLQDADRRELPALRPLLEALSRSTAVLRQADWNLEATDRAEPSSPHVR